MVYGKTGDDLRFHVKNSIDHEREGHTPSLCLFLHSFVETLCGLYPMTTTMWVSRL